MRLACGMVVIGAHAELARLVSRLHAAPVPFTDGANSAH